MLTVAAVQMVSQDDVAVNLEVINNAVQSATQSGAQFIVLPENAIFMGRHEQDKLAIAEKYQNGPIQTQLSMIARQHGCWLLLGSMPLQTNAQQRVRSASLLYDPQGECVTRYDKIHLFDVSVSENESHHESKIVEPGCDVVVQSTPMGCIGLSICYDLRFPELYREMVHQGAQIICVPSAFTQVTGEVHWEALLRARAIENQCYVIAANQGGKHACGRQTYGHSMIINPWGDIMAYADQGFATIYAQIDLENMQQIRDKFPALKHRVLK